MNTLSIIGSGKMAFGIGTRMSSGGVSVTVYDRDLEKAKTLAEKLGKNASAKQLGEPIADAIVVLAVPYVAEHDIATQYAKLFDGKTIIEISNPINFQTFEQLLPRTTSAPEELAKLLPGSVVLKAFNTTFSGTLVQGSIDGKPLDVFVAGDNAEKKKEVMALISLGGLRAFDAGPLVRAQALEGFQYIHMVMQPQLGNTWMSGIKILP